MYFLNTVALLAVGAAAVPFSFQPHSDLATTTTTTPSTNIKSTRSADADAACASVHFIVARASTEAAGPGVIGALATTVMSTLSDSTMESIDYPALLSPYASSSGAGTQATIKALNAVASSCPSTKIVLMGYSQGAHIILDAVCGGGATSEANAVSKSQLAAPNAAISTAIQSQIVAIVQYGDPRKIPTVSYNDGTSTGTGLFPRTSDQLCSTETAAKIQSYCDSDDEFCDSGTSLAVHLGYVQKYDTKAASFIEAQIAA